MGWADICGCGRREPRRAGMVRRPEYRGAAGWRISCRRGRAGDARHAWARLWRRRTRGDRGACGVASPRPRPRAMYEAVILLATAPGLRQPLGCDVDGGWSVAGAAE